MSATTSPVRISNLTPYPGPLQGVGDMPLDDGANAYKVSPPVLAAYSVGKAEAYNNGLVNALDRSVAGRLREAVSVWDFLPTSAQTLIESGARFDITDAFQKAMAAGRRSVVLPPGNYHVGGQISFGRSEQALIMNGANISAAGTFDLFSVRGVDNCMLEGGFVDAGGLNGTTVKVALAGRTRLARLQVNNALRGVLMAGVNNVTMYDLNFGGIRGEFGYRVTHEGPVKTDIVRMYACGATGTDASALAGMVGLHLLGDAASVEAYGVHFVRPGIGLLSETFEGRTPFGFNATSFAAADFSAFQNVWLKAGSKFYFGVGFYGHAAGTIVNEQSWNDVPGVQIDADCQYVQFSGGGISSPRGECMLIGGDEVDVTGMVNVRFDPPNRAGKIDTIRVLGTANNWKINDNTLGSRTGIGAQSRYQVMIEPGARNGVITGNNGGGYFLDFLCDRSGGDLGNIQHHGNTGARFSEVDGVRTTRFAGAHADFQASIGSGAVNGWVKVRGGNDWTVPPASWVVVGDGFGATANVVLDGIGGLNVTATNGGTGYTWAELAIIPAVTTPHIVAARVDDSPAQDTGMKALGGAAVVMGNSRGTGLSVGADAGATNFVVAQGRPAGSGAELRAEGTDTSIHLIQVAKGPDGHVGVGNAKIFNAAGSLVGYECRVINGTVRLIPFYATP